MLPYTTGDWEAGVAKIPLMSYATDHWADHAKFGEQYYETFRKTKIFSKDKSILKIWISLYFEMGVHATEQTM